MAESLYSIAPAGAGRQRCARATDEADSGVQRRGVRRAQMCVLGALRCKSASRYVAPKRPGSRMSEGPPGCGEKRERASGRPDSGLGWRKRQLH
eukprot:4294282-Prymnesium_polylepis.1